MWWLIVIGALVAIVFIIAIVYSIRKEKNDNLWWQILTFIIGVCSIFAGLFSDEIKLRIAGAQEPETGITTVAQGNNDVTPNDGDESLATDTAAGFVAQFGLSENDFMPDGFIAFERADKDLVRIKVSEDKFEDWSKAIYDKIKTISTDGRVYRQDRAPWLLGNESEWSAETNSFQWAYPYNGEIVNCSLVGPLEGLEAETVYRFGAISTSIPSNGP